MKSSLNNIFLDFNVVYVLQSDDNNYLLGYGGGHMNDMITEVRVFPKENLGKTLGFANITLMDKFVVKNLRIVKGDKGIFIGMPSNKRKNGEYIDLFFPITQEARDMITGAILDKYNEVMEGEAAGVEHKVNQV